MRGAHDDHVERHAAGAGQRVLAWAVLAAVVLEVIAPLVAIIILVPVGLRSMANVGVPLIVASQTLPAGQALSRLTAQRRRAWTVPVDAARLEASSPAVTVGVRPEAWRLVATMSGEGLEVRVDVVEELGSDAYVYGRSALDSGELDVVIRLDSRETVRRGDVIAVTADPDQVHVFDTVTGERLVQ